MSIVHFPQENVYSLNTKTSSYQFMISSFDHLLHLYFGKKNDFPLDDQLVIKEHALSGQPYEARLNQDYSLDTLPQEFPFLGEGDYRKPALIVEDENGTQAVSLKVKEIRYPVEKKSLHPIPSIENRKDCESLEVTLWDERLQLEVILLYSVYEELDLFARSVRIKNNSQRSVRLKKVHSICCDFLQGNFDLVYFQGRHAMERKTERIPVNHGIFTIRSNRGTSSHHYNPAFILARPECTENQGECYGFAFEWSGNFLVEIEKDYLNQIRVLMGLDDENFSVELISQEVFQGPEVLFTRSEKGFSRISRVFHEMFREYGAPHSKRPSTRPVLLNSWEAFYFDFDHDRFMQLAREAKELGLDMIVLDDGWFGKREKDDSSLGDWIPNEEKLGGTLRNLVDEVHDLGLEFGLWIEPEMISEDSDLFRKHPEYALGIPGKNPVISRNQRVLDFSKKEVVDEIFSSISKVLDDAPINYIKWDMNRSLSDLSDGAKSYQYVLGVYDLLDRLQERYPDILFEGCAGGGGRFDLGMLYYAPQIWTSDNTDPVNRSKIQYGTSFFYPPNAMSAHVSASPNHQTGRMTSLDTRSAVAMQGIFGYELDLTQLGQDEKEEIKRQIQSYKNLEPLIQQGDFYRLSDPFKESYASWMFVSPDQQETLITLLPLDIEPGYSPIRLLLKGLQEKAVYKDVQSGKKYRGSNLMNGGLPIPEYRQYEATQIHLKKVED